MENGGRMVVGGGWKMEGVEWKGFSLCLIFLGFFPTVVSYFHLPFFLRKCVNECIKAIIFAIFIFFKILPLYIYFFIISYLN